jgi:hypothetical protein
MRTRTAAALGLAAALAGGATSIAASEDAGEPVRDALTGHLADGSIEAKFAPAGIVYNVSEEPSHFLGAYFLDTDDLRPLTGAIPRSELAEADDVLQSRDLPLGSLVESGVFKNPGPDPLQAKFMSNAGLVELTLQPGEGVLVGSAELLATTHEPG